MSPGPEEGEPGPSRGRAHGVAVHTGLAANINEVHATHYGDDLRIEEVEFEAGAYTFLAYIDEAPCDDI